MEALPNHVNAYLREASGDDFTAKDFRTWLATVACAEELASREKCDTQAARRTTANEALAIVAAKLGNTPVICRKWYVHPSVLAALTDLGGVTLPKRRRIKGLSPLEASVLAFLLAAADAAAA